MTIVLFYQEGPQVISVFKLTTRTTGALEAINGVLGKRIMKHDHFFKLVAHLLAHEYEKSRDFDILIASGGLSKLEQKRQYKVSKQCFISFVTCDNLLYDHMDDIPQSIKKALYDDIYGL